MIPRTRQQNIELLETYKQEIISEHDTLSKRVKVMEKLKLSTLSEQLGVVRTTDFNKLSDGELDRIVTRLIASV